MLMKIKKKLNKNATFYKMLRYNKHKGNENQIILKYK
jgi:hypothetical protein